MITIKVKGDWKKTTNFLIAAQRLRFESILHRYGKEGVAALSANTPVDSGITSTSWRYSLAKTRSGYKIDWYNTHTNNGVNVAILIQYGHGTGTGGYVQPTDYINPAMKSIFNKFADDLWQEVKSL